jgi:PAS domain S-box-containing protein
VQPHTFFSLKQVIDRQPLTVTSQTPLTEVIGLMQEWGNSCRFSDEVDLAADASGNGNDRSNNSCVLVVSGRCLEGIFTERDLVKLVAAGIDTAKITVGKIMTGEVVTLTPTGDEDTFTALSLLRSHGIRHLPVVDDNANLIGLITAKNLRQKLQPMNLMKWRRAREVMKTEVICAKPDDSVRSTAILMANHHISCVAICQTQFDPETDRSVVRPVGIITERDIVQFQNLNLDLEQPAGNLMSTPLFLVSPEDSLWNIYQQMKQRRVRRLLVCGARGELAGIITQTSLLQVFDPTEMYGVIRELQRQVCQLETEREIFLEKRNAELEREVQQRIGDLQGKNQQLQRYLTEKNQAEAERKNSEQRFNSVLSSFRDVVWSADAQTLEILYLSTAAEEIYGRKLAEFYSNPKLWLEVIHPEDRDRVTYFADRLLDADILELEYRIVRPDGEIRWLQDRRQVIYDGNNRPIRWDGIASDISEQQRREEILKDIASGMSIEAGENFLPSLVRYLSQALQVDCAYVGELVPPGAYSIKTQAVYNKGQIIDNFEYGLAGTPCINVVQNELCIYPQGVRQLFPDSARLAQMQAESFAGMPILDSAEKIVGLICIVNSKPFADVPLIEEVLSIFASRVTTELERQQAEADLQQSNRILQSISSIQTQYLAEVKPEILFARMLELLLELTESVYGFIGEIQIAADGSPTMEKSYLKFRDRRNLESQAMTNVGWNNLTRLSARIPPLDLEVDRLQTLFDAVMVTGETVIANCPGDDSKQGEPPLNTFLSVPFYKNGKMTGMVGIANRQGGYNQALVDYLQPFLDTCSRIIEAYQNERQKQQAIAKNLEQAALLDVATDAIMVLRLDNQVLFWNRGAEKLYGWTEAEALAIDANQLLDPTNSARLKEIQQTAIAQGEWQGELSQVTKAGKKIIVESRWTLVRDTEPSSFLVVNTDITEQKQLERQFLRTQRLESLGTLAGGIAHDLNNILAPILGFAKLLPLRLPNVDEQTEGFFKIMETNALRGSALVKQILTFSRGLEGDRGIVGIRHLIAEIGEIINETFPKSIELEIDVPKTLSTVNADVNQLHQVLMNLAVNARDAMPHGGTLSIKADNFTVNSEYARLHLDAAEGSYVLITVTDTGVGIPPEIVDRIFEPFFTTKEIGRGTGLGLSTVIGIIKSHGGFVDVKSDCLQGTQFKIFLPAYDTTVSPTEENAAIPQGRGELVLVVDDESSMREVTKATLETYNYKVLTASNGIEAIALYAREHQAIELVIMDIMMPEMDGKTAIRTLKQINPEVNIVAVSGLITSQEIVKELDSDVRAFMSKPYTNEELLEIVHLIIEL